MEQLFLESAVMSIVSDWSPAMPLEASLFYKLGFWGWLKRPLKIPTQPNPAITNRSSREFDAVRRRGCIEHGFAKGLAIQASTGTEASVVENES